MKQLLPSEVAKEVAELVLELQSKGWTLSFARYDAHSFGNWYIDLCQTDDGIRLTKDRSQSMLSGPPTPELEASGLWKAFDDLEEFR